MVFHPVFGHANLKRAYIVTGPESSGSVFITRVISYVLGKDLFYKQSSGYGFNGNIGDDLVILHLSQPFCRPAQFCNLAKFHDMFGDYELYFILTTRDLNIINKSKKERFGGSALELEEHLDISREILGEIIRKEKYFIWNYETQIYLGAVYFELLYNFLQVKSNFLPGDLYDANEKYLKTSRS